MKRSSQSRPGLRGLRGPLLSAVVAAVEMRDSREVVWCRCWDLVVDVGVVDVGTWVWIGGSAGVKCRRARVVMFVLCFFGGLLLLSARVFVVECPCVCSREKGGRDHDS